MNYWIFFSFPLLGGRRGALLFLTFNFQLLTFNCSAQPYPVATCPDPDPVSCAGGPAHCDCGSTLTGNGLVMENSQNVNFDFNSITAYTGGITFSGATIFHIKMDSINKKCADGATCQWKLVMYIDDFGAAGGQWDKTTSYGSGAGAAPSLSLLQVRVYNGCNTPICESFQSFNPVDGAGIDIINSASLVPPSSPCGTLNVNGVGSFLDLNEYNDYTFTIDYRIQPPYNLAPGNYQVQIEFCLQEQ